MTLFSFKLVRVDDYWARSSYALHPERAEAASTEAAAAAGSAFCETLARVENDRVNDASNDAPDTAVDRTDGLLCDARLNALLCDARLNTLLGNNRHTALTLRCC
jgi:hypothetical protein